MGKTKEGSSVRSRPTSRSTSPTKINPKVPLIPSEKEATDLKQGTIQLKKTNSTWVFIFTFSLLALVVAGLYLARPMFSECKSNRRAQAPANLHYSQQSLSNFDANTLLPPEYRKYPAPRTQFASSLRQKGSDQSANRRRATPTATHRVENRVLLLTVEIPPHFEGDPDFQREYNGAAVLHMMEGFGLSFDHLVIAENGRKVYTQPLDLSYTDADGVPTGKYSAIVLENDLMFFTTKSNSLDTALSQTQWEELIEYEQQFGSRRVVLHSTGSMAIPGISIGLENFADTTLVLSDVAEAYEVSGINPNLAVDLSSIPQHAAVITDHDLLLQNGLSARPVLEIKSKKEDTIAMLELTDLVTGVQHLLLFVDSTYNEEGSWEAGRVLAMVYLQWAMSGSYKGHRFIHFGIDLDDWLMSAYMWDTKTHSNNFDDSYTFRTSIEDAQQLIDDTNYINSRLPPGSNFKFQLPFNGHGVVMVGGIGSDDLIEYTKENKNNFYFLSHTLTHRSLDVLSYDEILNNELIKNHEEYAKYMLDLDDPASPDHELYSKHSLVPPMITGLRREVSLRAMTDFGIDGACGDNTLPELLPTTSAYHPRITKASIEGFDGFYILPRHDSRAGYDCPTIEQNLDYNNHSPWEDMGPFSTIEEAFSYDVKKYLRDILALRKDSYMFHQTNAHKNPYSKMHNSNGGITLAGLWANLMIDAYLQYYNLPLITLKMDDLLYSYASRYYLDMECDPHVMMEYNGLDLLGIRITVSNEGCQVPLTNFPYLHLEGLTAETTTYGPDETHWITVSSDKSVYITSGKQCGNGQLDLYESCDGGAHCTATCTCADGYVPTDPVSGDCVLPKCGNGKLELDETCDSGDYCTDACVCVDGYVPTTPKSTKCRKPNKCGNGILEPGEECGEGQDVTGCDAKLCTCLAGYIPTSPPSSYCTSLVLKPSSMDLLAGGLDAPTDYIAQIGVEDQSGITNTWNKYMSVTGPFKGVLHYEIPSDVEVEELLPHFNYMGDIHPTQTVSLSIRNKADTAWIFIADSGPTGFDYNVWWTWKKWIGRLKASEVDIPTSGQVQLLLETLAPAEIDVDCLVVHATVKSGVVGCVSGMPDGILETSEECDSSTGCGANCKCDESLGYLPDPSNPGFCTKPEVLCGNAKLDNAEECDGGIGCSAECTCLTGYTPATPPQLGCDKVVSPGSCGDGVLAATEACDGIGCAPDCSACMAGYAMSSLAVSTDQHCSLFPSAFNPPATALWDPITDPVTVLKVIEAGNSGDTDVWGTYVEQYGVSTSTIEYTIPAGKTWNAAATKGELHLHFRCASTPTQNAIWSLFKSDGVSKVVVTQSSSLAFVGWDWVSAKVAIPGSIADYVQNVGGTEKLVLEFNVTVAGADPAAILDMATIALLPL